jgi:bacteriorhodopsin
MSSAPAPIPAEQPAVVPKTLKLSFNATYALLWTTGAITLIEALRTKNVYVRHIMNVETVISIVAAFFYAQFLQQIKQAEADNKPLNYKAINTTRYTDWFITTPLILLALTLTMEHNSGTTLKAVPFIVLLVLNFAMLGLGYAGDNGKMNRNTTLALSFIAFAGLFGWLYYRFGQYGPLINRILFGLVFALWLVYGAVYKMSEERKNMIYNVLDALSKCFMGILLWVLLAKVIEW